MFSSQLWLDYGAQAEQWLERMVESHFGPNHEAKLSSLYFLPWASENLNNHIYAWDNFHILVGKDHLEAILIV